MIQTAGNLASVKLTFYATADMAARIREYGAREDRDASSVIRLALARFFRAKPPTIARGRPRARGATVI